MSVRQIVWPYKGFASNEQIESWHSDAVENGDVEAGAKTYDEMAKALDDAGLLTLVRPHVADVAPREQDLDRDDGAAFDEPVRDDESDNDSDFDERDDFDHEDRFADLDPSPYDGTYSEE